MDQSTQAKQRFLRQQILESSYDPEEFISFLKQDLKVKQLDVTHLQMRALQSIVAKFKQYKYYQEENKKQAPPASIKNAVKRKKIEYEKSGVTFDYQFEQTIKCVHVEAFSSNLQVYVPKVQLKQTEGIFFSLGSTTEVWFIIQTNLNKTAVKRLQADFQWLSETVVKLYPLMAIPELIAVAKQNKGNNEKRRKQLQEFIQILAQQEQMKRSNLFYQFLTTPAEKIQKMKKSFDSMSFVKNIHSVKKDSGQITITLTNKLRNYVQNTADYVRKLPKVHENISQSFQKIMEYLESTSKEIYKVVDYFAELHQSYNQIVNKSPQYKVNQYNQILINTNNLFHVIANDIMVKVKTFNTNLKQFSKISLNYDKSINKIYRNLTDVQKDYVSFKASLNKKKERIYPQVSKWQVDQRQLQNRRLSKQQAFDLMLPKQTILQNQQKQWVAFLYNNYKQQFQKYLNFDVKRHAEVYCTFCSQLLLNNKNYVQELTKFVQQSKKLIVKG